MSRAALSAGHHRTTVNYRLPNSAHDGDQPSATAILHRVPLVTGSWARRVAARGHPGQVLQVAAPHCAVLAAFLLQTADASEFARGLRDNAGFTILLCHNIFSRILAMVLG